MGVSVRDARPDDAEAIAAVHVAAWEYAYRGELPDDAIDSRAPKRADYWRACLGELTEAEAVLVVVEDGVVRGFAHCTPSSEAGTDPKREALWRSLYIDPAAIGGGLAHRLRMAGLERLSELGYETVAFWTVASNKRARKFFLSTTTGETRPVASGANHELRYRVHIADYLRNMSGRTPERS